MAACLVLHCSKMAADTVVEHYSLPGLYRLQFYYFTQHTYILQLLPLKPVSSLSAILLTHPFVQLYSIISSKVCIKWKHELRTFSEYGENDEVRVCEMMYFTKG